MTSTTAPVDTTSTSTSTIAPAAGGANAAAAGAGRPGIVARLLRLGQRSRRRRASVPRLSYYGPASSGALDFAAMGARIAEVGPAASPALMAQVAHRARAHGMTSHAVGVLTDSTAPDVARTRAFAVVTADLVTSRSVMRPEAAA